LAQAGEDVTFIARGEHLAAIRSQGLRVESVHGDFMVAPARATDSTADVGPVDLVLMTTKTYQLEDAAREILPLLGPHTVVLPLENGVDAAERVLAVLGGAEDGGRTARSPVVGGACWVVSAVTAPGVIQQRSQFRRIVAGELEGPVSPRVQAMVDALARAGVTAEASPNISKVLWTKFLFIVSLSGIGAVTRVPAGEIMACAETRSLLEDAMREVEAVARAEGVTLDDDVVAQTMDFCANLAPDATTSMQRDILAGRRSELEAHNGFMARRGAQLGIPVPTHGFIYGALLPQDLRTR
jgi:2-dehydropantoate 2-reductase